MIIRTLIVAVILFIPAEALAQETRDSHQEPTAQAQLPKRVRWSKPLCKEIDQQGRLVGTIDSAIVRCDEIYVQGQAIRTIESKPLYVSSIAGYYENFYVADVFIANTSGDRVDVLSEKSLFIAWVNSNQPPQVSGPVPPEKIAAKIKSRAKWATFFGSLRGALATRTVEVRTATQGTVTAMGPGGMASGVYSESSTSTVTMPDREAQRRAQANNERIRAEAQARGDVFLAQALLSTTLFPGQEIRGAVFFEKKKFSVGILALEVGGTNFEFGIAPPDK